MDKTADGIAAPATDGDAADPESGMTTLPVWFDPEKGPLLGCCAPSVLTMVAQTERVRWLLEGFGEFLGGLSRDHPARRAIATAAS